MNNREYRKTKVHFPKCTKTQRKFEAYDEETKTLTTVIIDKNNQICSGSYFATHKGRPVKITKSQILCPTTVFDPDSGRMVFDGYQVLINRDVKIKK